MLGNWLASFMGLPRAAADLPISVHFRREGDVEHWTRRFGAQIFYSSMRAGRGRCAGLLCERVGAVDFAQELLLEGDRLRLLPRRWSLFSIPLPLWLGPRSNSFETERDGRFCFHVEISHPFTGPIVRYVGWLVAAEPPCR